jgi:outer membrane protein OmpA-like peptidoglycan-associated protein
MKNTVLIIFFHFSFSLYASDCTPVESNALAIDLTTRQSQLINSLEDCPTLNTAIKLSEVYQNLKQIDVAEEVLINAQSNLLMSPQDEINWLLASIKLALKTKNTCQTSHYLNELSALTKDSKDYRELRKKLYQQTQNHILSSQDIGCALTTSRSISSRGMQIRPKLDLAIHFDFNSANLTAKGILQTKQLAKALIHGKLKNKNIEVTGHTDAIGSDQYNLDLSKMRSKTVESFLIQYDSSLTNRISTTGMGESQLLSLGGTENDHQLNRRVEIQTN